MRKGSRGNKYNMTEEGKRVLREKAQKRQTGKTYEEIHGVEKAKELREKCRQRMKVKPNIKRIGPTKGDFKKGGIPWNKDKKLSKGHRANLSLAKGGKGKPGYGFDWKDLRLMALQRDNYKCQRCGKDASQVRLVVHHKEPYKKCKNNSLDILITLCRSCHMIIEPYYIYRKDIVRSAQINESAESSRNGLTVESPR